MMAIRIFVLVFVVQIAPGLFASQALAEAVLVKAAERGMGYLVGKDGHCYLVTARHVVEGKRRAQVIAEGGATGTASVRFPFWPGMDLAVGVVRRGAAERCSGSVDDFKPSNTAIGVNANAFLLTIDDGGQLVRREMQLLKVGYLDLEAKFVGASEGTVAYQGMSGGVLVSGGRPIGMALEKTGDDAIRFMRSEEVYQNVNRWASGQAEIVAAAAVQEAARPGLKLAVLSSNVKATGPDHLVENLLENEGSFEFEPVKNAEVVFEVLGEEKAALHRFKLVSDTREGVAIPRRVVVLANAEIEGGRWRTFWSGDMPRDGLLDPGPRAATWARRIKVIVPSYWGPGTVSLAALRFE